MWCLGNWSSIVLLSMVNATISLRLASNLFDYYFATSTPKVNDIGIRIRS